MAVPSRFARHHLEWPDNPKAVTLSDDVFENAVRAGEARQHEAAAERLGRHEDLKRIAARVKAEIAEAVAGDFFGTPRHRHEMSSDAHFPHVNFGFEFSMPGHPRLRFDGEVRWLQISSGSEGGRYEDHSRCSFGAIRWESSLRSVDPGDDEP